MYLEDSKTHPHDWSYALSEKLTEAAGEWFNQFQRPASLLREVNINESQELRNSHPSFLVSFKNQMYLLGHSLFRRNNSLTAFAYVQICLLLRKQLQTYSLVELLASTEERVEAE